MPSYRYSIRKPAPVISIDITLDRPSAEKATKLSKPSSDRATQGVSRKKSDG